MKQILATLIVLIGFSAKAEVRAKSEHRPEGYARVTTFNDENPSTPMLKGLRGEYSFDMTSAGTCFSVQGSDVKERFRIWIGRKEITDNMSAKGNLDLFFQRYHSNWHNDDGSLGNWYFVSDRVDFLAVDEDAKSSSSWFDITTGFLTIVKKTYTDTLENSVVNVETLSTTLSFGKGIGVQKIIRDPVTGDITYTTFSSHDSNSLAPEQTPQICKFHKLPPQPPLPAP